MSNVRFDELELMLMAMFGYCSLVVPNVGEIAEI